MKKLDRYIGRTVVLSILVSLLVLSLPVLASTGGSLSLHAETTRAKATTQAHVTAFADIMSRDLLRR